MAMLGQFSRVSRNFSIFNDRLGPGLMDGDSFNEIWGNHIMAWNLVVWCNVPWSGSLCEMGTLSQCSHFMISSGRGCCRSLNVLFALAANGENEIISTRCQTPDKFIKILYRVINMENHNIAKVPIPNYTNFQSAAVTHGAYPSNQFWVTINWKVHVTHNRQLMPG